MKKIFIIMVILLPSVFIECSKSDEEQDLILLNTSEVTLYQNDERKIDASSKAEITYLSENEYHATVSNVGVLKGRFVGETKINLKNSTDSKDIKVTVAPRHNLYPEPNVTFGELKSSIISKLGNPQTDTSSGISYTNYSANAPILMFIFDSSNKDEELFGNGQVFIFCNVSEFFIGEISSSHREWRHFSFRKRTKC